MSELAQGTGTTTLFNPRMLALHERLACWHPQAEPVNLMTGELVACVCISCLRALPFDWIQNQRDRAETEARCEHDREVDITAFGKVLTELLCTVCGRKREE